MAEIRRVRPSMEQKPMGVVNEDAKKGTRLRRWLPVIVCFVLMTAGIGYSALTSQARSAQLAEQQETISGLENRVDTLQAAQSQEVDEAVHIASGLDTARVAEDDATVKKLFDVVFNWDSKESYDAARAKVMSEYGLDDTSTFMQTFMPEMGDIDTGQGTVNEIDARGLNMSYSDMQSNVVNISGDRYSYFTVVTVTSSDSTGATAEGESVFTYTVDGSGNLSDLAAYSVA